MKVFPRELLTFRQESMICLTQKDFCRQHHVGVLGEGPLLPPALRHGSLAHSSFNRELAIKLQMLKEIDIRHGL